VDAMKKKSIMSRCKGLTLEAGFDLHLESCKLRNLREGTIRHYKDSYRQFMKFFPAEMQISEMNEKKYNEYILCLKGRLESAETVHTYGRDLRTVLHFWMNEGYLRPFKRIGKSRTSFWGGTDTEIDR
jgi:integrase/recombinase XerD